VGSVEDGGLRPVPSELLLGHLRPVERYAVEALGSERRGNLELSRYLISAATHGGAEIRLSLRVCMVDPAAPEVVLSIPGGGGVVPDDALWWLADRFGTNQAAIDWIGRGQSPAHDTIVCLYDPIFMETDDFRDSFLFHNLSAIWAALNWLFHVGLRPVDIVGGSWGGVFCFLLAALDGRVERIFSSFGCGGFSLPGVEKRSMWDAAFEQMGPARTAAWCAAFDPLLRMPSIAAAIYYETATNDKFFSLDMAMATWRRVRNPIFLGLLPNRDHDMRPFGEQPYRVLRLGGADVARCRAVTAQRLDWDPVRGEVICAVPDQGDRQTLSVVSSEQHPAHGDMSREWEARVRTDRGDGAVRFGLSRSDPAAEVLYFALGTVTSADGVRLHAATPVHRARWEAGDGGAAPPDRYETLLGPGEDDTLVGAPIGDKCHPAIRTTAEGWTIHFNAMLRGRATRFGIRPWLLPRAWQSIEVVLAVPVDGAVDEFDLVLSRRYQRNDEEAVFHAFRGAAVTEADNIRRYRFERTGFVPGIIVEQRFREHGLPIASSILGDFDAVGIVDFHGRVRIPITLVSMMIR
jgi:pimeloyl-ACP methyl ester carboxylesterase